MSRVPRALALAVVMALAATAASAFQAPAGQASTISQRTAWYFYKVK